VNSRSASSCHAAVCSPPTPPPSITAYARTDTQLLAVLSPRSCCRARMPCLRHFSPSRRPPLLLSSQLRRRALGSPMKFTAVSAPLSNCACPQLHLALAHPYGLLSSPFTAEIISSADRCRGRVAIAAVYPYRGQPNPELHTPCYFVF